MTKYHALIPARGGSKRISNKNLKKINGKSLIEWTIKYALKQKLINEIFVCTDIYLNSTKLDNRINLIDRPDELNNSTSSLLDLIRYVVIKKKLNHNDNLLLLLPTAPLRVTSDFEKSIDTFSKFDEKRLIMTVSPHTHPPELSWSIDIQDNLTPYLSNQSGKTFSRKQNYKQRYFFDECIILDKIERWLDPNRSLFGFQPIGIINPAERGFPIDYPVHLKICENFFPPYDERRSVYEWDI